MMETGMTLTDAQMIAGVVVGFGAKLTLDNYGLTLLDPATRWNTVGILTAVIITWADICLAFNILAGGAG